MEGTAPAHCPRCASALEVGDLRCPVCALTLPADTQPRREAVTARLVRCDSCGAALEYSARAQAPRCAYCASVMRVEVQADPVEQAERHVPFGVTPEAARQALDAFLSRKGFFRPSDLAGRARLDSLRPLWWPAWAFTAEADVSWTADSNAGAQRSAWAPHAGRTHLVFRDVLVPASRGLTQAECQRLVPAYRLAEAEPSPRGPEGAQAERFDVTRSGARRQILAAVEAAALEHVRRAEVPGTRSRNAHVAVALTGLRTTRHALPAYVLAYRYRDTSYRVVVHGQDAACTLGQTPVSVARVLLAVAGVLLALGLLALALLAAR